MIALKLDSDTVGLISEDEFLNAFAREEHRMLVESGTISVDELIELMNEELAAIKGAGDYRYEREQ